MAGGLIGSPRRIIPADSPAQSLTPLSEDEIQQAAQLHSQGATVQDATNTVRQNTHSTEHGREIAGTTEAPRVAPPNMAELRERYNADPSDENRAALIAAMPEGERQARGLSNNQSTNAEARQETRRMTDEGELRNSEIDKLTPGSSSATRQSRDNAGRRAPQTDTTAPNTDTIPNSIRAQANAKPGDIVNGKTLTQADIDWARAQLNPVSSSAEQNPPEAPLSSPQSVDSAQPAPQPQRRELGRQIEDSSTSIILDGEKGKRKSADSHSTSSPAQSSENTGSSGDWTWNDSLNRVLGGSGHKGDADYKKASWLKRFGYALSGLGSSNSTIAAANTDFQSEEARKAREAAARESQAQREHAASESQLARESSSEGAAKERAMTISENALNRRLTQAESNKALEFQRGENALNREHAETLVALQSELAATMPARQYNAIIDYLRNNPGVLADKGKIADLITANAGSTFGRDLGRAALNTATNTAGQIVAGNLGG